MPGEADVCEAKRAELIRLLQGDELEEWRRPLGNGWPNCSLTVADMRFVAERKGKASPSQLQEKRV